MSFSTVGLESQLKLAEGDIQNEEDALVVMIHWLLMKNGFLCVGLGDSVDVSDNVEKTELLAKGWSGGNAYAIRYLDPKSKLFILRALKNDTNIIFNLVRTEDLNVTSVSFNAKEEVKVLRGNVASVFPHIMDIGPRVQSNMITPQQDSNKESTSTQTRLQQPETERGAPASQPQPRRDPLMIGEPRMPRVDPFNYGHSDLDPLANRGGAPGGGMMFDPFADGRSRMDPSRGLPSPGLPRGAVPPGARFDPFGPPDPENFGLRSPGGPRNPRLPGSEPNPDMLPPGYDDMFM